MGYQNLDYGVIYHIYNRGNNKENLFKETRNYKYFLRLLKKYISPIADILAYCLLPNHYHLLIQVKNRDEISEDLLDKKKLSRQFGTCFGTYTKAINKAYSRTGKLFESRFKRIIVKTDQQYFELLNYIHQNPEKHGLVEDYREWPFSSYQSFQERVIKQSGYFQ